MELADRFNIIRRHYETKTIDILSAYKQHPQKWTSHHISSFEWNYLFSPIEKLTWAGIRFFGKAPLYPQYPVLNKYFLDFGNPAVKVAIECDGIEWHQDKEKDNLRDQELSKAGWTVFRISGAGCYKIAEQFGRYEDRFYKSEETLCYILKDYYTTIDGLIKAISFYYFNYFEYSYFKREMPLALQCLTDHISPVQYDKFIIDINKRNDVLYDDYNNFQKDLYR